MKNKVCRKCGTSLVVGENVTQYRIDHFDYICRKCVRGYMREHQNDYLYRTGRHQSMSENTECAAYLGVHVAERMLSHLFKNVERMPYGNPGFDFRCGRGYLVDVKCACRRHRLRQADSWGFVINKNQIAQYFLCLAFDSRDDLNPEHIWLIPAGDINDKTSVTISERHLYRWSNYEHPVTKVVECCDAMRESDRPKH